ncbi:MAG TPA: hypothetical protein VGJ44_01330 [Kribbellaceae bacterium]
MRDPVQPPDAGPAAPGSRSSVPRLAAALATVLAAVLVTASSTFWIWNRADALTPVDLPSANATPLETVTPSAKPLPPPDGHLRDGVITNGKGDKMPALPAPRWKQEWDQIALGGVAQWMTVHKNYDGKGSTWGDLVGFGIFDPSSDDKWTYSNKPADLKYASQLVGGRMITRLYKGKAQPIKGTVKHRALVVDGHPAHEVIARVPVREAKLAETYSQLAIVVIDRGDGSAAVAYGDFAGTSAAHWLAVWRQHVLKITIAK